MAGITYAGTVAKAGEDVFPTTGPHLDVRVLKDGQYIDPATWRSGLQRLKVGKEKTPLYQQKDGQFSPSFEITSGYGPRSAPTKGASTEHKGIDFGVAGGEQLFWEGPGTFKPGKGYGSIMTPEGYEVRLLHTKGGQETAVSGQPPQTPTQQPGQLQPNITIVDLRGQKEKPKSFLDAYKEQLISNAIGPGYSSPQRASTFIDPLSLVTSMTAQQPVNYFA